jgi:hypothetical protein
VLCDATMPRQALLWMAHVADAGDDDVCIETIIREMGTETGRTRASPIQGPGRVEMGGNRAVLSGTWVIVAGPRAQCTSRSQGGYLFTAAREAADIGAQQ